MELPRHLAAKRPACRQVGLSLIEVLLAVGIMALLLMAGLPVGLDFYQRYQFDSEFNTLVSLLEQARNLAMVNYNESAHGVYISSDNLIIFQGSSYAARNSSLDKSFPKDSNITIDGPSEIVFSALSGQAAASSTFTASTTQFNKKIYVNSEGAILY